eukprot:m.244578 g.244578  ORF g.244578 m.244578 type:complete len:383 (-) comp16105_c0_seq18:70-1218(-)
MDNILKQGSIIVESKFVLEFNANEGIMEEVVRQIEEEGGRLYKIQLKGASNDVKVTCVNFKNDWIRQPGCFIIPFAIHCSEINGEHATMENQAHKDIISSIDLSQLLEEWKWAVYKKNLCKLEQRAHAFTASVALPVNGRRNVEGDLVVDFSDMSLNKDDQTSKEMVINSNESEPEPESTKEPKPDLESEKPKEPEPNQHTNQQTNQQTNQRPKTTSQHMTGRSAQNSTSTTRTSGSQSGNRPRHGRGRGVASLLSPLPPFSGNDNLLRDPILPPSGFQGSAGSAVTASGPPYRGSQAPTLHGILGPPAPDLPPLGDLNGISPDVTPQTQTTQQYDVRGGTFIRWNFFEIGLIDLRVRASSLDSYIKHSQPFLTITTSFFST